jgi:hypothetical protein
VNDRVDRRPKNPIGEASGNRRIAGERAASDRFAYPNGKTVVRPQVFLRGERNNQPIRVGQVLADEERYSILIRRSGEAHHASEHLRRWDAEAVLSIGKPATIRTVTRGQSYCGDQRKHKSRFHAVMLAYQLGCTNVRNGSPPAGVGDGISALATCWGRAGGWLQIPIPFKSGIADLQNGRIVLDLELLA